MENQMKGTMAAAMPTQCQRERVPMISLEVDGELKIAMAMASRAMKMGWPMVAKASVAEKTSCPLQLSKARIASQISGTMKKNRQTRKARNQKTGWQFSPWIAGADMR